MKPAFALFAGLLCAASVQAEIITIAEWQRDVKIEHKLNVAPGKFVEICGPLAPGVSVVWGFDANTPLNFNIHYHLGKDVRYPAKQDQVQSRQGKLVVETAQDYCWMWTNKSAKASQLSVSLLAQ
jgi:hypothetical protein